MGLVKCSECGKEISDMAQSCPNCGRPLQQNQQGIVRGEFNTQNAMPMKTNKKKGRGCLITVIILLLIFLGIGIAVSKGIGDMEKNSEKYDDSIAAKYIDITSEESNKIDSVLKECGIDSVTSFEHDELLDGAHSEGETGYRLAVSTGVDNIILYLNADNSVYSLSYNTYDLYKDGSAVATIGDYAITDEEASNLQIKCQEIVKETLKSPSMAKFPSILEWGFSKEKNIVTVQGYVDAQNSFGAEVRSTFQFIIDTDADSIQSFIFDGQEMIQQ